MMKKDKILFGKIDLKKSSEEMSENVSAFGTFGTSIMPNVSFDISTLIHSDEVNNKSTPHNDFEEIQTSLGFTSFGKKARQFDINNMVTESKIICEERNKLQLEKLTLENNEKDIVESLPSTSKVSNVLTDDGCLSEDDIIGPAVTTEVLALLEQNSDNESDDEGYGLPVTSELYLHHGSKPVSALAVDPAGSRLVTGSVDYDVKYWDFQGMDVMKEAFRSFRPSDGYPVNSVEYSCTGDKVLVTSGSVQAKVYDRDGIEIYECPRGDMYLQDMRKTNGHVSALTDGKWHPKNKDEFLTSSADGTCRIWKTDIPLSQQYVIKPRNTGGLKAIPTTCNYSKDGLTIACACMDGSVQMWDHRKSFVNTISCIRNAHSKGSTTSCITFSYDNKCFATRGENTLKLWDIRNYKQPINLANGLFSRFSMTNCIFSPDDKMVMTGTSLNKGEESNSVKFFDRNTFNIVKELVTGPTHIIKLEWHPRLNQIMMGCGNGDIVIYYDITKSRNGAILVASKNRKRTKQVESIMSKQIIIPHALPMFREDRYKSVHKREEKDRKDPVRSHQPELPLGKMGSGGRVASGGSTLSSYIIRNMGLRNKVKEEEDPREALMRHAKEAATNPYWVTPAYATTQPKTIFQQDEQPQKKQRTSQ